MTITFDPHADLILLPVLLKGPLGSQTANLMLDTGANTSAISDDVLSRIGIDPRHAVETVEVFTASGVSVVPLVLVIEITAMGLTRKMFPVLCHTLPPESAAHGVLGLDFIRGKKLVIDMRKGKVSIS